MGRPYRRSADGRWVQAVRGPDGRRRYLYGHSKAEVLGKLDDLRIAWRQGLEPAPNRLTVGAVLDEWVEDRRGKVASSTWISYEGHVRIHLAPLARIPIARLTPADVRQLVRHLEVERLAPRTIAYSLTVLRMGLRHAIADGLIPRNVAEFVHPPKAVRAELVFLSADQVRALVVDGDPLWTFLVGTGCRLGEALGLREGDVAAGRVTFRRSLRPIDRRVRAPGERRLQAVAPKTEESARTVALPAFVLEALERQAVLASARPASVDRYLFTSPRGTPLDPRNVSRAWSEVCARLGFGHVRIHDLRHTYAAQLLGVGYTLEDVKRALGHSSIAQTSDTYGHLVEARSRELADGLDRLVRGA